jgi:LmbE family N-acetylglucosaminyl deacetylase
MQEESLRPDRVLVIMAHPDDPEFSAGGTIAKWSSQGSEVVYVIVTDGSKGSDDLEITPEQLISTRKGEQTAAAELLGVRKVEFLDLPDSTVYNTPELRRSLTRQIRKYRPDLIITHDPRARVITDSRINHPDHLAVGDTTLDAIFPLARDRLTYPELEEEGLSPHKVMHILLSMTDQINFIVDITNTIDDKIEALRNHKSQIGDLENLASRIRERSKTMAKNTEFTYAEGFWRVNLTR